MFSLQNQQNKNFKITYLYYKSGKFLFDIFPDLLIYILRQSIMYIIFKISTTKLSQYLQEYNLVFLNFLIMNSTFRLLLRYSEQKLQEALRLLEA